MSRTTTVARSTRPYQSYVYAYPHKTAYRPLAERPVLRELWAAERKDALSLYLHIPFCEVRCGFCNLFTRIGAPDELTTRYLDALDRQATAVRDALGDAEPVRFAAAAFGGGTPTFLTAAELERLCDIAEKRMGADLRAVALSVETSPSTATADRLAVLADRGTTRISIGVQSFVEAEARAAVRPQRRADVEAALDRIRDARIPVLNIDLIYGIDGQTEESWRTSLDAALGWRPEELYLYPLYVRPLTGLGRLGADGETAADAAWDEQRLRLYRAGRDHLLAHGYEQVSMRMFRRADAPRTDGPDDYACQTDGMIGLGCGARSYTTKLHYSFDYAVEMREVRAIIDGYTATEDFSRAEVGRYVDGDEARRRHLLQSVLQAEGLRQADYRERFGTSPADDFPVELARFEARGWLDATAGASGLLRLSPEGLAHSDALGPELFSPGVRAAMAAYELK
ncbi:MULTISPECIES: STM4012 family radical SAM protein [unclassified Streptomyces]|uniref:STM4012 family radical SAM protein n=1 Tax=unclassified Streptomyces TaxID=2593676 RepID=UPI00224FF296|nr:MULTISPECIES: STM4012 family radical SAM protein [unclassified Streptomyces]WSP59045.1 STM4012 family radical SAM protein [Streptomyces sp. NBC_01241]MCX4790781.1 STM4012 family radical SAM protein [Streptomyces sp. NBC_01221]MCX4793489.1 STM4012 family radical SAM protein [Streptomyces sp. NBC_01242]WSJ34921.1 STM4012 family radical SAM protein [Streptomyces sp. NBC_01321]WSP61361.1 STM4012 family radical SAM protein [Streptomyces sp. NBC_01240]